MKNWHLLIKLIEYHEPKRFSIVLPWLLTTPSLLQLFQVFFQSALVSAHIFLQNYLGTAQSLWRNGSQMPKYVFAVMLQPLIKNNQFGGTQIYLQFTSHKKKL